ncbi:hypothetical protein K4I03_2134 [Streptococcus sanguinis]|nr:hypothetical protein [Streptococcus sanguinis]
MSSLVQTINQSDVKVFKIEQVCDKMKLFHMNLSNDGLVAFHYKSYGTFCIQSKSSIIPAVDLPTTEIIEPKKSKSEPWK